MNHDFKIVYRGEIWMIDWNPGRGSEQTGYRPSLIVQRNSGSANPQYGNVIVVTISSKSSGNVPFHLFVRKNPENGLSSDSYIKCEQIITISKQRLVKKIGQLQEDFMNIVYDTIKLLLQ
jgi:mRNA interferase MazF